MKITTKSTLSSVAIVTLAMLLSSCCKHDRPPHFFDRDGSKCDMPKAHYSKKMFEEMDKDSDGKITESEFTSHKSDLFKRIDVNGDGAITKDEIKDFHHKDQKHPKCKK